MVVSQTRVLISDSHVGTTMWQHDLIQKLGNFPISVTLSNHSHYAPAGLVSKSWLASHLQYLPRWLVRMVFRFSLLAGVHLAVCSFPPKRLLDLTKLPNNVRLLLNIGHRIHIHLAPADALDFTEYLKRLAEQKRVTVAAMSEFDFHYLRYHTGVAAEKLPVTATHVSDWARVPGQKRKLSPVVLVGPAHRSGTPDGFDIETLNEIAGSRNESFSFELISRLYPQGSASPEKLSGHLAVVIFPYSAFSISMIELYQMNIPFFVPTDHLLVGRMNDVRISPLYHSEATREQFEQLFLETGLKNGYQFSPHSTSPEAELYWLKFMFFNQVENAIRFDSADHLVHLLHEMDGDSISREMAKENARLFDSSFRSWSRLIPNTSGSKVSD